MPAFDLDAIDKAAVIAARRGDEAARTRAVKLALPLGEHLARRFAGRGESMEDLIQVASIGLLKALDRFDAERGVRFSTYATPTIMGELKRHFRDSGWAMHLPRRLKERALLIRDAIEALSQELGRNPTMLEIAERTDLALDDVLEGLDASSAYSLVSLDAPHDDEGTSEGMTVGGEDWSLELTERWTSVAPLLRELDERARRILYLRFVKGMTQSQIAKEIGFSQMHVSRLLSKTLDDLRSAASGTHD